MEINEEKLLEDLNRIVEENALISKGADYYHGMKDLVGKIRECVRSYIPEPDVTDTTFCQEYCKGYQETHKCICDGKCKAYKEYEEIVKLGQEWRNKNCPNAPSVVSAYVAGAMMQKKKNEAENAEMTEKAWAEGYTRGKAKMKEKIMDAIKEAK